MYLAEIHINENLWIWDDWINAIIICQMIGFHSVLQGSPEDKHTETQQMYPLEEKQHNYMTSCERELKVVSTHQAGRRWYRSWLRDPPPCWLLPPRCSGSLGPDWESARIRLSRQLYGWCGTYSHSPSTKSAIIETKRKRTFRQCYEGFVTTFSLVAATNLCPYNWSVLLLQHFSALWVLRYISEVGKYFTTWLYVL